MSNWAEIGGLFLASEIHPHNAYPASLPVVGAFDLRRVSACWDNSTIWSGLRLDDLRVVSVPSPQNLVWMLKSGRTEAKKAARRQYV